jgi:polysaccharide export outer membrane protein
MKKIAVGVLLCLGIIFLISGCGLFKPGEKTPSEGYAWEHLFEEGDTTPVKVPPEKSGSATSDWNQEGYRLKFDDTVMITFLGISEFRNTIEERVDDEGEISLPYVNSIKAEGKTSAALEDDIVKAYVDGGIYKSLGVKVVIPNQNFYYIRGEVKHPGSFSWRTGITLAQAIAQASGYTEYATRSRKVSLTRGGEVREYKMKDIAKRPELDVVLRPNDQIRVLRGML